MSVRELYDAVAHRYDATVRESAYIGPAWLAERISEVPIAVRAIDLGCANGNLGRIVRQRFPRVELVGVDVSPTMVAVARAGGGYNELHVADLNLLFEPHITGTFELAVALGFAEFLSNPRQLLREIGRIVVPGGVLLISFQEHWQDRPSLAPRVTRSGVVEHRAYTMPEVRNMLCEAGFATHQIESRTGYVSRSGFACPYLFAFARKGERET